MAHHNFMNKKQFKTKSEVIKWHHFTRHGDAIFLSLGREIRIAVLSVATLTAACPESAAARLAMSQRPAVDEDTTATAASSPDGDAPLDLTALQQGDLLFNIASPSRDGLSRAITSVAEGIDLQQVSHVAIVCREPDGQLYALEASSRHGVWLHPISSYFAESDHSAEGLPLVLLGRLKDTTLATAAVERAKSYLGRPYDFQYLPSDSAIYCSELIQLSYFDATGEPLFPQVPMSFHDSTGAILPFWTEHYRQWDMAVPEGLPGTHPGGISRSDQIDIVGRFF